MGVRLIILTCLGFEVIVVVRLLLSVRRFGTCKQLGDLGARKQRGNLGTRTKRGDLSARK